MAYLSVAILAALALVVVVGGRSLMTGSDAQPLKPMGIRTLPPPALSQASLKDALQSRASHREFASQPLDDQTLSNLLWAAYGINRAETGARTAPTAYDWRHMELYIADAHGIGRYDANRNAIESLATKDIRALTGMQDFVKSAPLTVILVSDEGKMSEKESYGMKWIFSGAAAGAIAQNIYLYCASAGLNVVVRASFERDPLHKELGLGSKQKIVVAQTIGFPPDSSAK